MTKIRDFILSFILGRLLINMFDVIVVFTYPFGKHNVVPVNGVEYDYCGHAIDSKVYRSGNDTIKLKSGSNYFICDFPNHCESGMKLRLFAA